MADSKCCQGMDPSCEGPSSCADRAWAEVGLLTEWRKNALLALDKREAEIGRLQRWKVEACSVLADWDALYVGLGDRGELGQRKSAVVAAEIERLRAAGDALADYLSNDLGAAIVRSAWEEARHG